MIYITGDKHGSYQLNDLCAASWPEGQNLSKNDFLIIAGDFGGVFYGDEKDNEVLDFYESSPWTTLLLMVTMKILTCLPSIRLLNGMAEKSSISDQLSSI